MLNELKDEVLRANLELAKQGLITLTWGNVSGLDRERKLAVIKPSGVFYDRLRAQDMVVVALDGKVVEGKLRPSSDTPTHLALYRTWPDVGGVTHTHSTYATMFAQACRPLECYGTTHADGFHGPVPITRALTEAEVKEAYEANTGVVILEQFAPNPGKPQPLETPGVLVANHGPFVWGKDAWDAVEHAVMLEACAQMALGTLLLAPSLPPVPQYIMDKHYFRKHGPGAYYGQKG
ncbi:MAG: L-ribulose-5-phosphate 4-epimerase AraD [Planctomycetota bacterium]